MIYVLDTHALVWHLMNSPRLGQQARQIVADASAVLVVPSITLAEARFLSMRGRIPLAWEDVVELLDEDARCEVHPLDRDVVERLPVGLNIHDAIICATALLCRETLGEDVCVITRDGQIIASGLVETVW